MKRDPRGAMALELARARTDARMLRAALAGACLLAGWMPFAALAQARADGPTAAASAAGAPAPCRKAVDYEADDLHGLWRAEFDGGMPGATVLIERHPEHAGSFSGAVNRNGERARIAGDLEDGEFTLEESANGVNISATWLGTLEPTSCGTLIRGTWQDASGRILRQFTLRRLP